MKVENFIGWRKLTFAIVLTIASTVALFLSVCDFDQWSDFQKWIYSAYALTNVGERFTDKIKSSSNE